MNTNLRRNCQLGWIICVLVLVILACSEADKAPLQTLAAQAAQTALAEGKKAAGTEAAHLVETAKVAGSTQAASIFGTLSARIATEAHSPFGTLNAGHTPQFTPPVSGEEISLGDWGPGDGDHKNADLYAIDFVGPAGTPVRAALDGKVVYSDDAKDGYGYVVALRHVDDQNWDKKYYSIYAHLDGNELPALNATVSRNAIIGHMGKSGTGTVHLHFAVRMSAVLYEGTMALYGQKINSDGSVEIYTEPFNVRAQFGLNP